MKRGGLIGSAVGQVPGEGVIDVRLLALLKIPGVFAVTFFDGLAELPRHGAAQLVHAGPDASRAVFQIRLHLRFRCALQLLQGGVNHGLSRLFDRCRLGLFLVEPAARVAVTARVSAHRHVRRLPFFIMSFIMDDYDDYYYCSVHLFIDRIFIDCIPAVCHFIRLYVYAFDDAAEPPPSFS